jgi:hypothetical protein
MSDEDNHGYAQFERWKKFINMKRSANDKQKTPDEEQQEFTAFMEFERMNSIYNKRDSNPMHTPKPSTSSSTSSSSNSSTSTLSRTSSENSERTSSSKKSKGSTSEGHRHFKLPNINLTPSEFEDRLKAKLTEDVMQDKLVTLFKPLSDFRDKYIIPLSKKCPGQEIELTTLKDFDTHGFLSAYLALFINGCHVRRQPRKAGEIVIPDSKEREMYRHLFKDLWGLLGTCIYIYTFNI